METISNYSDIIGIILTIFGILLTIYFETRKNENKKSSIDSQHHQTQHNQLTTTTNNISNQVNIIQQNNTAPNVKDNKSFTFAINKETLKNIAIFIAGIICGYLAYRAYRRLALENSQDCIKN
ncbi:hypothetical protein LS68_005240 [Helicobacter sp. MIT 05-5293]|uniref:hypothetical protein n=1 Tax=Helicobacter sp. MIT 05-5293 TaxID=1548149 RepID=UPI00051D95B6|nr:hypothetical protein [Helicobacter sp. MIT 05-5293]TLD80881.1 hypothetical protein LS68_005240 [Helicobacter sp. MIT 05-5293]